MCDTLHKNDKRLTSTTLEDLQTQRPTYPKLVAGKRWRRPFDEGASILKGKVPPYSTPQRSVTARMRHTDLHRAKWWKRDWYHL